MSDSPDISLDQPGNYVAQLIVNDGTLDSDPDTAVVKVTTVTPPINHAPEINTPPVTAATVGQAYRYDVDATDSDGDTLAYSLTTRPTGMTIAALSGVVDWTPSAAGSFDVTVEISDGKGATVVQAFQIVVGTPPPVQVPNLASLSQAQATEAIRNAGLVLGNISQANSDTVPAGNVISQVAAGGTHATPGSAVDIALSLGPSGGGGGGTTLPPDPATIAPSLDRSVATTLGVSSAFLYSGASPIQTGVTPGTIEAKRAAVIRGRVLDKSNTPLSGVTVSILKFPSFSGA